MWSGLAADNMIQLERFIEGSQISTNEGLVNRLVRFKIGYKPNEIK